EHVLFPNPEYPIPGNRAGPQAAVRIRRTAGWNAGRYTPPDAQAPQAERAKGDGYRLGGALRKRMPPGRSREGDRGIDAAACRPRGTDRVASDTGGTPSVLE